MSAAIWWMRRDLRLSDNQALTAALTKAETVIPLFILDPKILASQYMSQKRLAFLFAGLRALDTDLRQKGSGLIVRQGNPLDVLQTLRQETGAGAIFAEEDISPYARRRDESVMHELPLTLTSGVTVQPAELLRKADGTPYTVFTPFSRLWHSLPFPGSPLPAPEHLPHLPNIASLGIPDAAQQTIHSLFPAGELEAQRRLNSFSDFTISRYAEYRNRMDIDGTSGISPYLRFGMLSARQAAWSARQVQARATDTIGPQGC